MRVGQGEVEAQQQNTEEMRIDAGERARWHSRENTDRFLNHFELVTALARVPPALNFCVLCV